MPDTRESLSKQIAAIEDEYIAKVAELNRADSDLKLLRCFVTTCTNATRR